MGYGWVFFASCAVSSLLWYRQWWEMNFLVHTNMFVELFIVWCIGNMQIRVSWCMTNCNNLVSLETPETAVHPGWTYSCKICHGLTNVLSKSCKIFSRPWQDLVKDLVRSWQDLVRYHKILHFAFCWGLTKNRMSSCYVLWMLLCCLCTSYQETCIGMIYSANHFLFFLTGLLHRWCEWKPSFPCCHP